MQPAITITQRRHPPGVIARVARVYSRWHANQDARLTELCLKRRMTTIGVSPAQPTRLCRSLNPTAAGTLVIALPQKLLLHAAEIIQ